MKQPESLSDYKALALGIDKLPGDEKKHVLRYLFRTDLFFLLWYGCSRTDMAHPWLLARCKEVQADPDGYLDLWAREHYKSTIITFGKTIQDILSSHGNDPLPIWDGMELTFGIFSHTRPIAKGFLRQIKREFEGNGMLRLCFPDIIWEHCHRESSKWSEDDGLILKRESNPKEATVEAWGIVEGQPTGKHFAIQIYDDIVTLSSVYTPEMVNKTRESWEMSLNLGAGDHPVRRYVGTRYHFNDLYDTMMKRGSAKPRIYPATDDGTPTGKPVLKSKEKIKELYRDLGVYTFSTQQLLNPASDKKTSLSRDWLNYHNGVGKEGLNRYILIDPASEKKKTSDYTSVWVIGLGADRNYYVLDMYRDRLNLVERGDLLFRLHKKWRPLKVGYEKYGMQADIEYYKEKMRLETYHFPIIKLGGKVPKIDRIKALVPSLSEGRWYFPESLLRTQYDGKVIDVVDAYINEEYLAFPVPVHDDMLDTQARILDADLNVIWPRIADDDKDERYSAGRRGKRQHSTWAV